MTLSFSRTGDNELMEHVNAIVNIGASVTIASTEDTDLRGSVTRVVTVTWMTHNSDARVIS